MTKKFLSVFVLVMMVCSAAVFAEVAIDFSGSVQTGIRGEFDKENGNSFDFYSDEYDEEDVGLAVLLDGSVDAGNVGAEFELAVENFDPILSYGYGWFTALDGLFTVNVGLIDNDTWATHGDLELDFADTLGLQFICAPMEGLTFGFITDFSGADLGDKIPAEDFADCFTFAAGYENDAFALQGAYNIAGSAYVGFDFTGVEGFVAIFECGIDNIGADPYITLCEVLGYSITDALYAEVICTEEIDTTEGATPVIAIEPCVAYGITENVEASLGAGFIFADGFDSFYINPAVAVAITDSVGMSFGYEYNSAEGENDNVIQLDFVWNY